MTNPTTDFRKLRKLLKQASRTRKTTKAEWEAEEARLSPPKVHRRGLAALHRRGTLTNPDLIFSEIELRAMTQEQLLDRVQRVLDFASTRWHIAGYEPGDLKNEAFEVMLRCQSSFQSIHNFSFNTYLARAIDHEFSKLLNKAKRHPSLEAIAEPMTIQAEFAEIENRDEALSFLAAMPPRERATALALIKREPGGVPKRDRVAFRRWCEHVPFGRTPS